MGLYGLDTPPEFGGPDIDLVTRCLIAIECSQHRAGLYAPCYNVFGGARQAQLFEATEAQKPGISIPCCGAKRKSLDYQSRQAAATRRAPSRRGRSGMAMSGC